MAPIYTGDGNIEKNELMTLADAGIASITLAGMVVGEVCSGSRAIFETAFRHVTPNVTIICRGLTWFAAAA
jgi:hypothetical protein